MTGQAPGEASRSEPIEKVTFRALAGCFLAATELLRGPDVRAGLQGALVYGAAALDVAGLNRIMTADADAVPDERDIDAALGEVSFAPVVTWWIPPGPAGAEIEARLVHRGFAADPGDDSAPAMWISLDALPGPEPVPGLTIEPATSAAAVRTACMVAGAGFGMPDDLAAGFADLFARIADAPAVASRMLLARLHGRPVATALAVANGEAVVIYNVATLPDARGRGIGGAITLAALREGQSRGATLGVLESSEIGYGVYRRLGFRDAGRYRILARRRPSVAPA